MTETMTIRQMCDAFDVTPRTLRFYEQKELLFPIRIGTRRLFTRRDRARLKLILRGKRFGFNLEDLRQLLDLYDRDKRARDAAVPDLRYRPRRAWPSSSASARTRHGDRGTQGQLAWGEEALAALRQTRAA